MNKGLVTKIIDFSFVDGPGNRMAIFLQECNFNCGYCHNPETINKCIDCGICVSACQVGALETTNNKVIHNEEKCINCDKCVALCPHSSTPKAKHYTAEQLYKRIMTVKDFIQGITISGGECTLQWQFIKELFEIIKGSSELTTFIDSNGYIEDVALDNLIPLTDGFMLDLKGVSPDVHNSITEQPNHKVINSIEKIFKAGRMHELRYVVVPGVNDEENEIIKLGVLVNSLDRNIRTILIPFRNFGVKGRYRELDSPTKEKMEVIKDILIKEGLTKVIINN